MKRILFFLFLIGLLISCTKVPENPVVMNPTIRLLGIPQCNHLKLANAIAETHNSQSCVEFVFDQESKKLSLKHLNAGFNCCPESLWCTVVYRNDTIIVQEYEKSLGCKCNCLYDLNLELEDIEPGKYQLRMIEPYIGTQQSLVCLLDLQTKKQGSFCVSRTNYPW